MNAHLEILSIAVVVAIACALPGTFLVLRKRALISDAISHAVLPGIVLGFFMTGNINSPLLMLGAVAAGLFTAWLTELLAKTRLVKEDAAIGLVFPVLFSIGVLLVSRHAGNIHLDTDAVLLGELAFAPFDRMMIQGTDLGPRSLWSMSAILLLNSVVILLLYKELKLSTFDSGLAQAQGFKPHRLHYALMTLVSLTVVGAFDSVGSILVVALMVAPPAAAFLLTKRLAPMIFIGALIGAISAIIGYGVAVLGDVSIAGSMAGACGFSFLVVLLFAPQRGLVAQQVMRRTQTLHLGVRMLVVHLSHHGSGTNQMDENECRKDHLTQHIAWTASFANKVAESAIKQGFIMPHHQVLKLTPKGILVAQEAMTQ
ncbi:MAG: metal ABC transporter permease [Spirochaetales bacterium]|nr:metal ABC transporter permease [Spirochaetales bacterium]